MKNRYAKRILSFALCLALALGGMAFSAPAAAGAAPVYAAYTKGAWQAAFEDDFAGPLDEGKWDASGGEIMTVRTFSADDIRVTYSFAGPDTFALYDDDGVTPLFLSPAPCAPGQAYTMVVTFRDGNKRALCELFDGAMAPVWDNLSSPAFVDYGSFRIAFAAGGCRAVKVEMPVLVYYDDLIGALAAESLAAPGGMSGKLKSDYDAGHQYSDGTRLFRGVSAAGSGYAYDENASAPSMRRENMGFFIKGPSGGEPYKLQAVNEDANLLLNTSLWLMEAFRVDDNYDVVLEYDVWRGGTWTTSQGISLAYADGFNFDPGTGGASAWLGNLEYADARCYTYFHHNMPGNGDIYLPGVGGGTGRRVWFRNKIEISDTKLVWTLTNLENNAAESREFEFFGADFVFRFHLALLGNPHNLMEFRNFKIHGVPGERGARAVPPPLYSGPEGSVEATPDSGLFYPVIEGLLADTAYTYLDPAGQGSYETVSRQVPDTLDLAERGALAAGGYIGVLEGGLGNDGPRSLSDYGPYGHIYLGSKTPYLLAGPDVGNGRTNWGKIGEGLLMARNMSGYGGHLDVQMKSLVNMLYYTKGEGARPYLAAAGANAENNAYASVFTSYGNAMEHFAVTPLSRVMMTLTSLYTLNANGTQMDSSARANLSTLIDEIAYAHYHNADYVSEYDRHTGERTFLYGANLMREPEPGFNMAGNLGYVDTVHIDGNGLRATSRWAALGAGSSAPLGARITGLFKNFLMLPEPRTKYKLWQPEREPIAASSYDNASFSGHVHSYMGALLGLLEYGISANDTAALEFVRAGYEYWKTFGLSSIGLFGETCALGEMTYLAVMLSRLGVGDYWDDAERYVRNQLAEVQVTPEKLGQLKGKLGLMDTVPPFASEANMQTYGVGMEVTDVDDPKHVLNRSLGIFLSDASHPLYVHPGQQTSVICCEGNAMQGMYYAWEGIVTERDGLVSVNLPLNRASPWLDVDSYLPYEGKVELHNKTASAADFRVPDYVDPATLTVTKNGGGTPFTWIGNRILMTGLAAGDVVAIAFDLKNWTETSTLKWMQDRFWLEGSDPRTYAEDPFPTPNYVYTIEFRGNTAVRVECPQDTAASTGRDLRLYQGADRAAARNAAPGSTPMKSGVTRYIPHTTLKPESASDTQSAPAPAFDSAMAPDTLDLARRAALALDALLEANPAPDELGALANALTLARNMTGSTDRLDVDAALTGEMLGAAGNAGSVLALHSMVALGQGALKSPLDAMAASLPASPSAAAPEGQSPGGLIGYGKRMLENGAVLRAMSAHYIAGAPVNAYATALKAPGAWNLPEAQVPRAVAGPEQAKFDGKTSSCAAGLLGLLEYAALTGDVRTARFARTGYEYMRTFGINAMGLFGDIDTASYMTMLAVKLSLMGVGDYWDDAERYARNELTEKQRADGLFLNDSSYPGFVGGGNLAADLTTAANAVQALYSAWDAIVTGGADMAVVNLPLNRASPLLNVRSYLPFEGKLELDIKEAKNVTVRIPKWADLSQVRVRGASALRSGNTLILRDLAEGAQIAIEFPVKTWSRTYTLKWGPSDATHTCVTPPDGWAAGSDTFDITFRGYTVVDIAPAAANAALPAGRTDFYDRSGMDGAAPTKAADTYVPERTLLSTPGRIVPIPPDAPVITGSGCAVRYRGTITLAADQTVEWGGSNKYVEVHPDGTVESLKGFCKTGKATVTATANGLTTSYTVRVKPSFCQWLEIIFLFGWIWM